MPQLTDQKILCADKVLTQGTNIWAHVHVQDVSDMILLSIKHNLAATQPVGFARFYLYVPSHAADHLDS